MFLTLQVEARLMKQTPLTMRQVIAPKAGAVQNLSVSTAALPLTFSLMCSSVSSIAGYSGHANYAAANSSMDTYAAQQSQTGAPIMAVQWGAWSGIGTANLCDVFNHF